MDLQEKRKYQVLVSFLLIRVGMQLNAEMFRKSVRKSGKEEDQEAAGVSCASWLLPRVPQLQRGNSLLAGVITWTDPGRVGGFTAAHRGDHSAALPSG